MGAENSSLNNCRDRRIGHRLKLSLQIVYKGSGLLRVWESDSPWVDQAGNGVGTLITRLVILQSDWSSRSRDSSVALPWSFLHSLSRRVTDLCRRLFWVLSVGFLVICHCLRSRFFRGIISWMPAGFGSRGSSRATKQCGRKKYKRNAYVKLYVISIFCSGC